MIRETYRLILSIILKNLVTHKKYKQAKTERKIRMMEQTEQLKWWRDKWLGSFLISSSGSQTGFVPEFIIFTHTLSF
ncbi:MAG: hypothetical protein CENE_03758 [Candidatus Celerinatantimonas neptuna]|nr:MAG: hypothetical protein CENE_03758 [Candidatus Celerinatantimonas neptuna]